MKLIAAAAITAIATSSLGAAPIVLKEHLNQSYERELISVLFSAKDRECAADGVLLAGPKGNIPAQLSDIEFWPGDAGFVKSGLLWFVSEGLEPRASATYTPALSKTKAAQPKTDLAVKEGKDSVEINTLLVGARFPIGGATFEKPVAASAVPGPLLGMRLGNGAWAGGSALTGAVPVSAWSGKLLDSGAVFARAEIKYTFADSNVLVFSAMIAAGDNSVRWTMRSERESTGAGVAWVFPPVPGVKQADMPKLYGQWARQDSRADVNPGGAPFCMLSPNSSIASVFAEYPWRIIFASEDGNKLVLSSMNPGAWVDPVEMTYGGMKKWKLEEIDNVMWRSWKRQCMPVSYAADGAVTLAAAINKGGREWTTGSGEPLVGYTLNSVKDMVLDWPARTRHPDLFVGITEVKKAWNRAESDADFKTLLDNNYNGNPFSILLVKPEDEQGAKAMESAIKDLRAQLALMGNFDVMRHAIKTVTRYDFIIDSEMLSPEDRALFRAQMAYLGYLMADPTCWSMERGFCSGNPNMSCSYTLSLGIIGCALKDHPEAKKWTDRATQWMDQWLTDEVGPNGEWIPEGGHYSYVSLEPMLTYAVAARRAGVHDFSKDPRLKKLCVFFAKYNTPRDLRRKDRRVTGIYGRGTVPGHYDVTPCFGLAAAFYKDSDPALSRAMQWQAVESGFPYYLPDHRMGGCEPYFLDDSLSAEAPKRESELFPELGALLRTAFNTPQENYINLLCSVQSDRNLDVWTPEVGGMAQWYAFGKPVSSCFTFGNGYNDRHELLKNGVLLARNWGAPADPKIPFGHYTTTRFEAFASLPAMDYARSTFVNTHTDDRDWFPKPAPPAYPKVVAAKGTNLVWTRQFLFMKDEEPSGPAWVVLRDTVKGGEGDAPPPAQPTIWQFWTLSEKLGSSDQTKDRQAFLADKPGPTNAPARELPMGDRYTALGSFGVDTEFFVVSPSDTPRHTVRCGGKTGASPDYPDFQDNLHLQLPGAGAYHVALFPRLENQPAPAFASLAGGLVVKASGAFGTDYAFLSTEAAEAKAEQGVSFSGTAGSVQERAITTILSLPADGAISFKGSDLKSGIAASLKVEKDSLTLTLAEGHKGGEVTVGAPGDWKPAAGVKAVINEKGRWIVSVPAGARTVKFVKK